MSNCNHILSGPPPLTLPVFDPQTQRITRGGRADILCGILDAKRVAVKAFRRLDQNLDQLLGVIRGLAHIHSQSIVHGDLKALNILVAGDGQVTRICDFGTSTIECECFNPPETPPDGTPQWDSPELWMGGGEPEGELDEQAIQRTQSSDVWAFGCVALEVQMGMMPWDPFHEGDLRKMQRRQLDAEAGPPANEEHLELGEHEIKQWVWGLMTRCWNAAPLQRPTAAELLNDCEVKAMDLAAA
ncbi:unnamed protein product [Rhizoctonia solani]|uniref:Protein kinase domain-containing protein n=1 Tax=Rhizoctonia solani TaxID=456999 RepID=A0A8H3D7V6_9AGAM|nr:unnamed protein product [Rhizoctonia solani]